MLEEIYHQKSTIESLRNGPLNIYPDELAQYYLNNGYSTQNMRSRFGPLSQFNRWLINYNINAQDLDRQLIENFIALQLKTKKCFAHSGANFLFKKLMELLVRDGIVQPVSEPEFGDADIVTLLAKYRIYLVREKGLVLSSTKRLSNVARTLLVYLHASTIPKLCDITVDMIHGYIIDCGKLYSTKHVQLIASCVRCFYKYLFRRGIIQMDLGISIPSIKAYRAAHLPEYLEQNHLTELLESCDQQSATGSRNYAVLSLLGLVGLRASEVINLRLQDIDWRSGEFCIRGKGRKLSIMPLPSDVGESISNYLIHYRPKVNNPHVFLSTRAPFQQLNNPSTVSTIVRRQLAFSGIETRSKGAHLLRYTVATNCIRNHGSLYEACELLRHFSIDTTATYAKVDFERLTALAMPWPKSQEVINV
jgi:integrase/recombinase XerD